MAEAPKRSTPADPKPPPSTRHDWMPLDEAYKHVRQVDGGWQLAAEGLRQRLASGEIEAQDRLVTPGKGIEIRSLTAEDFKNVAARADASSLWFSGYFPLHGHNIFLRRTDVYRIWPTAGPAEVSQPAKQLPTTRPKGLGWKAWPVAQEVYALTQEGGKWANLDALLKIIRDRLGDKGLHERTLDTALAWLRKNGFINR